MSKATLDAADVGVSKPIGWDGRTLRDMLEESERQFEQTGHYAGRDELSFKQNNPFAYEEMYARLRGALVAARETALNISASPIVRELGELCFQVYTPEGDCVALSTGILVHVHTGSLAIKHMIRQDYEENPGIAPGDLFCNNDPDIGNVHTADVHTFVPIFHEGELIAWVDGVVHQVDIGGSTPGHDQIASTNRFEDGFYATCEKIGEDDELYRHWKERTRRGVRTPRYWDLDEKCRIAGCHMARQAVHEMIEDSGKDQFKRFMRESIEEGRRILKQRVQERLFPGTYREVSFDPMPHKEEAWKPEGKRNLLNHLPMTITVQPDGTLSLDMEGASPPGPHAYNCTVGAMEGALWVSLTQCLLHDGKVNDGSHFAVEAHYPEGSVVNPGDPSLSYNSSWGSLIAAYNAFWKNISRGFFARGFREEVVTGYGETSDAVQGGGIYDPTGEYWAVSTFDMSCQGLGASAVRDGLNWGYAMWNPESDMGDVEEWERIEKGALHLGRKIKPNTAGHGKFRGGSGWEGLRVFINSSDITAYMGTGEGVTFSTSGMSGGYPYACRYSVRVHKTDFEERIREFRPYPIGDSPPGSLEQDIEGEVVRTKRSGYFPKMFENGDLLHWKMNGGPGYGDPLERPIAKVKKDAEDGIYTPDVIEQVYGVVGSLDEQTRTFTVDREATERRRKKIRRTREQKSQSFEDFWEQERDRIVEGDRLSAPVREMYNDVFELSGSWADEYRVFWDLDEDFEFEEERS